MLPEFTLFHRLPKGSSLYWCKQSWGSTYKTTSPWLSSGLQKQYKGARAYHHSMGVMINMPHACVRSWDKTAEPQHGDNELLWPQAASQCGKLSPGPAGVEADKVVTVILLGQRGLPMQPKQ